ncbi:transposase [Kitasatospora sp. NPDC058190]|uniref:transposase n=1 Tax=Kitasatospora sp. NPDC058190 TaxID=3346371 RepID=UPI0036D8FE3A
MRSGIEGTIREFAHGHGMRGCRYRGQDKAHLQHVLNVIVERLSRLSQQSPGESASIGPPTAFQDYLDQQGVPRLRSCRAVS